jgi:hypothetical protein
VTFHGTDSDPSFKMSTKLSFSLHITVNSTVGIKVFLTFFCLIMEESGSGSVQIMTDLDLEPGGPKTQKTGGEIVYGKVLKRTVRSRLNRAWFELYSV